MTTHRLRVLFVCTHNSARSQMAEALLRRAAGDRVAVVSAGTEPGHLHPLAVRAMQRVGLDISRARAKSVDEFAGQGFDYVITLCDQARETCPAFPGDPERIHWSFPDPSAMFGDEEQRLRAFVQTQVELAFRIQAWVNACRALRTEPVTVEGGAA